MKTALGYMHSIVIYNHFQDTVQKYFQDTVITVSHPLINIIALYWSCSDKIIRQIVVHEFTLTYNK